MDEMILRIKLQPGTAEVLQRVAQALGTTVEEIATRHLETIKDALSYTSADGDPVAERSLMTDVLTTSMIHHRR